MDRMIALTDDKGKKHLASEDEIELLDLCNLKESDLPISRETIKRNESR